MNRMKKIISLVEFAGAIYMVVVIAIFLVRALLDKVNFVFILVFAIMIAIALFFLAIKAKEVRQ